MKINPILAVKEVKESSSWYQMIFGWNSIHGGNEFDVLTTKEDEVILCLHKWDTHENPSMKDPSILPGNGLILYFRVKNIEELRQNLEKIKYPIEKDIALNPNSHKKEFSLIDPNGYYLTISEFHTYKG